MSAPTAALAALLLAGLVARVAAQDAPAPAPKPWVELPAGEGPGAGRHIVLVSGDEEYRSEEALPMLGRLLSARHGFRCTVLFAVDPRDGTVNPNDQASLPGLAALDDADLVILFTRFRHLPDADVKHLHDYVARGKPVIGIRTATHAFAYPKDSTSPYAAWSWDAPGGGFGRELFGTSWVAHLGNHGAESTRGAVALLGAAGHPVLRGVADVWGPTDVYAVSPLPPDARVLLEGEILSGMTPDSPPVEDDRNSSRAPLVWLREIKRPDGPPQRVACSTIGAATDLQSEDLRRLFVNLCYWCTGLQDKIPERSEAGIVGAFEPTPFGFDGFRKGRKPADF